MSAVCALMKFANNDDPEPEGWVRAIPSMRRRPGGDKAKEYIAP
jgi:hypothetical protein